MPKAPTKTMTKTKPTAPKTAARKAPPAKPTKKTAPKTTAKPKTETKRSSVTKRPGYGWCKFTPERIEIFLAGIASGLGAIDAAERAGWSRATYFNYKERAAREAAEGLSPEDSPYVDTFGPALARAREEFCEQCKSAIAEIAQETRDWRAIRELMAINDPEKYGKQQRVRLQGDKDNPLQAEVSFAVTAGISNLTPEQQQAYVGSFQAALAARRQKQKEALGGRPALPAMPATPAAPEDENERPSAEAPA